MKQWFVINTLTGQEQKVQRLILSTARTAGDRQLDLTPFIGDMIMPTEKVTSVRNGRKSTITKKLFPGYLFIELELYFDERRKQLNKELWQFINLLDGVIGFLGAEKNVRGEMVRPPMPLTDAEIAAVRNIGFSDEVRVRPNISFEPGETVRIVDGPFMSSIGTVQVADPDHGRLTVSVSLFGGDTPVELEYFQVEKYVEEEDSSTK